MLALPLVVLGAEFNSASNGTTFRGSSSNKGGFGPKYRVKPGFHFGISRTFSAVRTRWDLLISTKFCDFL